MRLLLLLLLSITNIYAQEKVLETDVPEDVDQEIVLEADVPENVAPEIVLEVDVPKNVDQEIVLGVDIPENIIVEYDEWDNEYNIYSSNVKDFREGLQGKGALKDNYLIGQIVIIGDNNVKLNIFNYFWKDSEYQHKSGQVANTMFYFKNNDHILKKEMIVYLRGESGFSALMIVDKLDLNVVINNIDRNSTLRIKDFAGNIFEYEGEELKPLIDIIKLYKQFK